jgi:sugar-specific transcriptional regulator TrmB
VCSSDLYESRTYLVLLTNGSASATEISDRAGIPRPRVYDVLDKLQKRGFVAMRPERPVRFSALPLKEAFDNLKSHREDEFRKGLAEIDRLRSEMEGKLRGVEAPQEAAGECVWVIKDSSSIHSKIENLVQSATKSITISTSACGLERKLPGLEEHLRAAKQRGVDVRIVAPAGDDKTAKALSEFSVHTDSEGRHRAVIADDHVLIFLTPEGSQEETGAWIKSPYLADNLRRLLTE